MKKGFSFAVLAATVLIMVILLTSITIAGSSSLENSKKLTFATELSTLQQAVNGYSEKNNGMYPIGDNIVLDISVLNDYSKNQFTLNGEEITNDKVILNEIDYDKANITSLKYGNMQDGDTDIYAISPTTGKVYYAKGMKIDNKLYFTLTEELNNVLSNNTSKAQSARESENNLVIFSPTETKWTQDNVSVDIKIPVSCNLYAILVDGETISDYTTTSSSIYNVYTVSREGNYTIQVKYYEQDNTNNIINATYNVNNIDRIPPVLDIESKPVYLSSSEDADMLGYVRVIDKKDTLSGIKYFKYESNSVYASGISENEKQYVQAHFENNGENVDSNIIPIEKGSRTLTIYLEDNAGNWILQTINIVKN